MLHESLFVSDAVHVRTVKLPDGSEHLMTFREISAADFRRFFNAERSKDENERAGSIAKLIAASLCEEDGKPAITYERALKLKPAAANAIAAEILKLNGVGEQGNV